MAKVLLVNGPNLNMLGQREPDIYGSTTLAEIETAVKNIINGSGHELEHFQSNSEGDLVDWLQARKGADFLIINAASLTHTSVALRDVISFVDVPFIEIHISNVFKREAFRHHSFLSDIAIGMMTGLGAKGYELAASFAIDYLERK